MNLTLQYHNELNPKLWEGDKLKPEVREKLIEIGTIWGDYANIPIEAIKDIILVGGNANYNYTQFPDIDVHLLIDMNEMPDCDELLDDYLKDKKKLWSLTHNNKIYGHDVELYAQDIELDFPNNQGVYSLTQDNWLIPPTRQKVNLEDPTIRRKVQEYTDKIDHLITTNADDSSFDKLKQKFQDMRKSGLKKAGEFSRENLIFKELRNLGYFEKMNNYLKSKEDQNLSL